MPSIYESYIISENEKRVKIEYNIIKKSHLTKVGFFNNNK